MKTPKIAIVYLLMLLSPLLASAQTTESFTFTTNSPVPDGSFSGLNDVRTVNSAVTNISSLKVRLKLAGEYNGDMYAYLRHNNGFVVLLNRVGKTAANTYGYDDSGFDVTFQAGAANGDIHTYQNVTIPSVNSPLTGVWDVDGRYVDPTNALNTIARTTSLTNFNGLNGAGSWTLYLADVESGGTNMLVTWGLDISGVAAPTLAWTAPADITYGTALSSAQLNATVTYNSTNVPGTFTYAVPAGTVLNAGNGQTLAVTFTPSNTNNFSVLTGNVAVNVRPAALVVTANDANKVYGANLPSFSAGYSGFVNGDSTSSLTTVASLSTAATGESGVGDYAIVPSGVVSSNYMVSYVNGNLAVTAASLVITAQNTNKIYGATLPTFAVNYAGFVNGDGVSSLASLPILSTTATAASSVGTYSITPSGAVETNYNISYVNGTLTVNPAVINVVVADQSKIYGAALPTLTASYSGFVLGQSTNDLSTLATVTTSATASSDVGMYPITASGAASGNYSFNYTAGTLTISQAHSTSAVVSSLNPVMPGTNVTLSVNVSAVAPGAGTPTGTVQFRIDGSVAGSGALANGVATFSLSSLGVGSHTVAAEYAGDVNFVGTTNSLGQSLTVNTPPTATDYTVTRNPLSGVKIRVADLLTNATDADGGSLSLTVSPASVDNATVTVNGAWVFYTPAAGMTNDDSFTYMVHDGLNGTATATVHVTVQGETGFGHNLTIMRLENGSYQIDGNGIPGYTYHLQYSDTLVSPSWQYLDGVSTTADGTGKFELIDSTAGSSPMRFYRTVYP